MTRREVVEHIYGNPIAEARYNQIERDLRAFAVEEMVFKFNPNGTQLFSLMELRQSYARRSVDLLETIYLLLEADKIVPAAIAGRALLETIAMGSLFLAEMRRYVEDANQVRLEQRLLRFFAGVSNRDPKPIHVMDAVRHLAKIDAEYVAHLEGRFGTFTATGIMKRWAGEKAKAERVADPLSMMRVYDELSEIAHPNGTGVQYLYPDPRNEDQQVERFRNQFKRQAVSSTWQCKHLLDELEKTRDLPDRYRAKIGLKGTES